MSFPLINKQPLRGINIPDFSGGINLRDAIYQINDNQLTDCKNVWFKNGVLKSRPGSYYIKACIADIDADLGIETDDFEIKKWEIYREIGLEDQKCESKLVTLSVQYQAAEETVAGTVMQVTKTKTYFQWIANVPDGMEEYPIIPENLQLFPIEEKVKFVVQHNEEIYIFTKAPLGTLIENKDKIYKWEANTENNNFEWRQLGNQDIYIPTVMTDCKCSNDGKTDFSGAPGEAYNKLNDLCKIEYSSVNRDLLDISDETSTHNMRYYIPNVGKEESSKILSDFSLKITYPEPLKDANGNDLKDEEDNLIYTIEHKLGYFNGANTYYEFELGSANEQPDKVWIAGWVRPDGSMRVSFFTNETVVETGLKVKAVTMADYLRNNIVITLPYTAEAKEEIFNSDIATWYGGEASGIFGGTRLFLAGNGNTIIWSDLNNPLYFPQDCDMQVGSDSERITAFAKQNEQLIIFKEHSVWGSNYVFNSEITGEDLIAQTVENYEANTAYFPLIQLHPHIGCRVPQSIQLCRNRLVWADSNGKVYTLVSQSQYNERNVYELSDMIEKRLKQCSKEDLIKATSADFEGYYVLCVGNKLFLMDYNCYGYSHCYSYSKTEDGQKLIPWWYWEIREEESEKISGIIEVFGSLFYVNKKDESSIGKNGFNSKFAVCKFSDGYLNTDWYNEHLNLIDEVRYKKIETLIETKSFSFGTFAHSKHVSALNMALHGSGDIRITYISDKPELMSEEIFSLYSDDVQIGSPSYMQNILFRPNMRFTALFGVRLETEQGIAIGPVSLNYRLLGGNN